MKNWRAWSLFRLVATMLGFVVVVVGVVFAVQLYRDRSWFEAVRDAAPIGGVTIALLSLMTTAISTTANWRRQKRQESLKAWAEWSDRSRDARLAITATVGMKAFTKPVGGALANMKAGKYGKYDLTDVGEVRQLREHVVLVLNGLERMAVGIQMGVYDESTIRRLGGTIVVREWDRAKTYVEARRVAEQDERRQEKAYVSLEAFVNDLKSRNLKEERNKLDTKRLAILRGSK